MKRALCILLVVLIGCACPMTASAQASMTQVTDYLYTVMQPGGKDDTIVYTVYETSGALSMGTLTADGEQTRTSYSFEGWDALFAEPLWQTTVLGDGAALCPYAASHSDKTICPYLEIACITMVNTVSGVTLENYYIPSGVAQTFPSGAVQFCFGRYNYTMPDTLRWDGDSRYFALKGENGLWGVFDSETDAMVTEYIYDDMSAVYGTYAKVYNGTAWARLDMSGRFPTQFRYTTAESFSVREEAREIASGQWQVFTKDNEATSPVIEGDFIEVSYEPTTGMLLATDADGLQTMYDLFGNVTAQFAATDTVRFLQDTCYAVEAYSQSGALQGMALWRAESVTTSADTVMKGDVNFDGAINSIDARLVLQTVVAQRILTDRQLTAADVSDNGTVESLDVRELLRLAIV